MILTSAKASHFREHICSSKTVTTPSLPRNTCIMRTNIAHTHFTRLLISWLLKSAYLLASAYDVNLRRDLRKERSTREHMHRIGVFDAGKFRRLKA